jgi:hypothetical protein
MQIRAARDGSHDFDFAFGTFNVHISRLLHPLSGAQWSITFASSRDGRLGTPMIGRFENGRGEFYDREDFNGRSIFVRDTFSDVTPTSYKMEIAFSADGGKRWETNWIMTFTRAPV